MYRCVTESITRALEGGTYQTRALWLFPRVTRKSKGWRPDWVLVWSNKTVPVNIFTHQHYPKWRQKKNLSLSHSYSWSPWSATMVSIRIFIRKQFRLRVDLQWPASAKPSSWQTMSMARLSMMNFEILSGSPRRLHRRYKSHIKANIKTKPLWPFTL